MINTGYHIYPAEIEKVIRSVDGVADVLVRGEARPTYGHAIVAYIVADDSRSTDDLPNVVTGTLEAKLARHKRPHRLMLVKELPR
jgi:acyl-coenzyme A synthetase/AMP-(fatty) acid ligase